MSLRERSLADKIYLAFKRAAIGTADDAALFLTNHPSLKKIEEVVTVDLFEIDLAEMDVLAKEIVPELKSVMVDAATKSLVQLNIVEQAIVNVVNEAASEYAKHRAAEMVGKKWVDGKLVDNPNAEWVITDTTRDAIRKLMQDVIDGKMNMTDLRQAIVNAATFSKERAEMISRTELMSANAEGALKSFFEAEKAGLKVKKLWNSDNEACPICVLNTKAGALEIRSEFPSGHIAPPAHPNCECVLVSEVDYEDDEED